MQYVIVSFVEPDFPPVFTGDTWPLHITLLQPFSTDLGQQELVTLLQRVCAGHLPVKTVATDRAMFGKEKERAVTRVMCTPALQQLHTNIVNAFSEHAQILGHQYPEYSPHITDTGSHRFEVGMPIILTSVSLVARNGPERNVVHTVQ